MPGKCCVGASFAISHAIHAADLHEEMKECASTTSQVISPPNLTEAIGSHVKAGNTRFKIQIFPKTKGFCNKRGLFRTKLTFFQ